MGTKAWGVSEQRRGGDRASGAALPRGAPRALRGRSAGACGERIRCARPPGFRFWVTTSAASSRTARKSNFPSGGRSRSGDLWVMSPARYPLRHSAVASISDINPMSIITGQPRSLSPYQPRSSSPYIASSLSLSPSPALPSRALCALRTRSCRLLKLSTPPVAS